MNQQELDRIQRLDDPNIGFRVPLWGKRFGNPFGPGKEANVRDYIQSNELIELDRSGDLTRSLQGASINQWDNISKDFASRAQDAETQRQRTKREVVTDRSREFDEQEAYDNRVSARNLANQRLLMQDQQKGREMELASNERLAGLSSQSAERLAAMQGQNALAIANTQGNYALQQADLTGRYGLDQTRVAAGAGIEQSRIGANAQIRQAEIGARSARDVANISGNWNYRGLDLTSGRELTNSREQRGSEERRQTQQLMAQRQEMGEQRKREEASELLQSRANRARAGQEFMLGLINNRRYFA